MYLFNYVELIKNLTLREIKARYKQSFLGVFWVALNPFMQMLIMSFVFSKIIRFANIGVPYPLFVYSGLIPWFFLANSTTSSMSVLVENSTLIKKIYFPREVLILSELLAKLVDVGVSLVVFILMMFFYHKPITPYVLLVIPIFFLQFLFTYGISLVLSSLNLFYRDVQYLFNLFITLWFYLTPVIYATEFFPVKYRWIFKLNPMSAYINAYREVIFNHNWPNFITLIVSGSVSVFVYIISYHIFKKLEKMFADII